MYFSITISHAYDLSDYFKPEKMITGKNSYREYKTEDKATRSLKALIEYYKKYVEKQKTREVIMLNYSIHNFPLSRSKIYLIYWKNNQICMVEIEL